MFHLSIESYIKFENETLKYLESPEGINSSLHINKYYDTYIKDFQFKSGPKPEFNPWQFSTFKVGKKPKDICSTWGKISKGFFITNRFKTFLSEFYIAEHVIFDKINYFNGEKYNADLNWIAFYEDYSQYYLIQESTYFTVKEGDWFYLNDKYLPNYLEKGLTFTSDKEMEKAKNNFKLKGIELREEKIFINVPKVVNLFPLFNLWNGDFFCTENFYKHYTETKFLGLSFGHNNVISVVTPFD